MTTTRSQGLLSQDKTHLNIWNLRVERNTWRQIREEGLSRAVPMQRALTAKAACARWAALGAETSRARCTLNKRKGQQRNTGERCAHGQYAAVLVQVVSQGEGTVTELYWHSKLFSSTCTGVEQQLANKRRGMCDGPCLKFQFLEAGTGGSGVQNQFGQHGKILTGKSVKQQESMQMTNSVVTPRWYPTHLVVPIRPLLGWLGWSRLCCSVAPILLTLTLRIIRILRTWTALGRTCKIVNTNKRSGKAVLSLHNFRISNEMLHLVSNWKGQFSILTFSGCVVK